MDENIASIPKLAAKEGLPPFEQETKVALATVDGLIAEAEGRIAHEQNLLTNLAKQTELAQRRLEAARAAASALTADRPAQEVPY